MQQPNQINNEIHNTQFSLGNLYMICVLRGWEAMEKKLIINID
jgi:hypothetical protein